MVILYENSRGFIVDFAERGLGGSLSYYGMVIHVRIRFNKSLLPRGLLQADIGASSWSAVRIEWSLTCSCTTFATVESTRKQ